jgi:hypothetical protein
MVKHNSKSQPRQQFKNGGSNLKLILNSRSVRVAGRKKQSRGQKKRKNDIHEIRPTNFGLDNLSQILIIERSYQ